MKWLRFSDYLLVTMFILLFIIVETTYTDDTQDIFIIILNIILWFLWLLKRNHNYIRDMKRRAKEQKYINEEVERLKNNQE